MIHVIAPNNNCEERQYILDVILTEFLGVPYSIEYGGVDCWLLDAHSVQIQIEDAFFNKHEEALSYLSHANIPESYAEDLAFDHQIVRLWGDGRYSHESRRIRIGNDIFAASFFFLAQWEELVLKKMKNIDFSQKLPETELFLVRNKLYTRCIVNEYVELLRIILTEQQIETKKRHFSPMLTHDVDRCYLSSERELCENVKKMLEQRDTEKAYRVLSDYLSYPANYNPFDSFDVLMDLAEDADQKAHFYFKACEKGDCGYTYSLEDAFVKKAISKIAARGHYVGLHASENTYHNIQQLRYEFGRLSDAYPAFEKGGRSHLLMYDESVYDNMQRIGIKYDSGVGFQYYNGFRTSVCYSYPKFNVTGRRQLQLMQIPFNVMDSVSIRQNLSPEVFFQQIQTIIAVVKKYNGVFVSNWHSNLFLAKGREKYIDVYKSIMHLIKD